ncbi:MAG: hypothetical protein H0W12_12020 [Chitinophagaceae bacterium]|nr:hypothetical protein [Chitinophagaceae bacterium]
MYKLLTKLRSSVLIYLTHNLALPVLKRIRNPEIFPYTEEELWHFPEASLGYALITFLKKKGLHLLPHYARHDIKHLLLEYDTTDVGEVCLQCFMLGNRHFSFPVLATVMYGLITMPEHYQAFSRAFTRGGRSISLASWEWYKILKMPAQQLKDLINN